MALGLDPSLLDVHLVQKGSNIHEEDERKAITSTSSKYVIVVDQGSRAGQAIIDSKVGRCLIIDHHVSDEFPQGATVRSLTTAMPIIHCPRSNILKGRLWMSLSAGGHIVSHHLRDL